MQFFLYQACCSTHSTERKAHRHTRTHTYTHTHTHRTFAIPKTFVLVVQCALSAPHPSGKGSFHIFGDKQPLCLCVCVCVFPSYCVCMCVCVYALRQRVERALIRPGGPSSHGETKRRRRRAKRFAAANGEA